MSMFLIGQLQRAFASNPRKVAPTTHENAVLDRAGVHQPVLRAFLAWRRGLLLFTVVATVLSTGVSTWRQSSEATERPSLVEHVSDQITEAIEGELPDAEKEAGAEEMKRLEQSLTEKVENPSRKEEPKTTFGEVADTIQLAALYALQVAALAALFFWSRWQRSFQIMSAAFLFSFLVPLLIALCPWSWWGYEEKTYSPDTEPLLFLESTAEGLVEGVGYLIALLPTVISLVPATQRACIRVKLLLPEAMLPGWFLVVASPFYSLFLLVVFVALNQFESSLLLMGGLLLFLLAPLVYPLKASFYTRPLATEEEFRRVRVYQRVIGGLTAISGVMIVAFLASQKVLGVQLFGFDSEKCLVVPLDLIEFGLEVLSRSMFVTALGADMFMRMNLAAWKYGKEFETSASAANYDRVMGELATLG